MNSISKTNKIAWEYKSYDFWIQNCGAPKDYAKKLAENPMHSIRMEKELLGEVKGKKIANILGSNGRKAVPLALLGADVTVVDISKPNMLYALELALEAGVNIRYELCDFMEFDTTLEGNNDFDILYLEGGILHYFEDIDKFMAKLFCMLKAGGKLILHDFHPFRKIIRVEIDDIALEGDYFNSDVVEGAVAYANLFDGMDKEYFPKCKLRFYTMGEIITSIAGAGLRIEKLFETPRYDEYKDLPGYFKILASK